MANVTNSPNMNLPIPVVGQDPGPQWAVDVNSSLTLIDQHNHTPGFGVQIPPAGLNINTNLPFNNNSVTSLQAAVLTPQISYSTNYGLHAEGLDLYFVDGNGNNIRITSGGTVNATSSGISSGTATAGFSSGILVVNAASNTPANIQAASYLMGNNVASSNYLTLQPPNAMPASYSLTFPSVPGVLSFMALDASGNMSTVAAVSGGITSSNIASGTITPQNLAPLGQQISASCGTFTDNSGVFTNVTNLSVSINTTGRPVFVGLIHDGNTSVPGSYWQAASLTSGSAAVSYIAINRNGSQIYGSQIISQVGGALFPEIAVPVTTVYQIDTPSSGSYTYIVKLRSLNSNTLATLNEAKLIAYEL